jgi:hypothetical protein
MHYCDRVRLSCSTKSTCDNHGCAIGAEQERQGWESKLNEARLKLREAEQAWHAAFAAAPVGEQRIMAAAVYERIRCATRRPF